MSLIAAVHASSLKHVPTVAQKLIHKYNIAIVHTGCAASGLLWYSLSSVLAWLSETCATAYRA
jgi:hypothetical protein